MKTDTKIIIKKRFVFLPRICKKCFFKYWFAPIYHVKFYGKWILYPNAKNLCDCYRNYIDYYLCLNCIKLEAELSNLSIREYIQKESKILLDSFGKKEK